jgi:hypothetical protein
MANGARQICANKLAMLMIDKFRADADDDNQANLTRIDEAGEWKLLLALLWASERDLLVPIVLVEPDESPVLNKIHRDMKILLLGQTEGNTDVPDRGQGGGFMDDDGDNFPIETHLDGDDSTLSSARNPEATQTQDRFKELTMTTAGIVEIMKQVEAARQDERKSDAQEKSLLKHFERSQRALFLALSTPELYIDPELSEFMVQLSKEKTASRALQLIQSEACEWEGSFSAGGFHRFLSTGFLSQEVNRGNPGGYTHFMFHTRTTDLMGPQFDAGKARLRDLFEASVDKETMLHYSKQGLFAASNHHDMRVQLQTALDMLELLLGAGSIATKGLAYVLEPQRWRRMSVIFHDRFKSEAHFGAKFIYCLDRSIQQFFTQVELCNEEEVRPNYLQDKAADLISMIDGGYEATVRLPSALVPPPPANLALPASTSAAGEPAKKKGEKSGTPGPAGEPGSMVFQNSSPHHSWRLPEGKRYAEYFQGSRPKHEELAGGTRQPPGRPTLYPLPSHRGVPSQLSPRARGPGEPRRYRTRDRRRPVRRCTRSGTYVNCTSRHLRRRVAERTRLSDATPLEPTTTPTHLPFNGQRTKQGQSSRRRRRRSAPGTQTRTSGTERTAPQGPIQVGTRGRKRPRTKRPKREVGRPNQGPKGTRSKSQHPGYSTKERPVQLPGRTDTEAPEEPRTSGPWKRRDPTNSGGNPTNPKSDVNEDKNCQSRGTSGSLYKSNPGKYRPPNERPSGDSEETERSSRTRRFEIAWGRQEGPNPSRDTCDLPRVMPSNL